MKDMKNKLLVGALGVVGLIGCVVGLSAWLRPQGAKPTPTLTEPVVKPLQVSTSFYPLYFFSSVIGGEKVTVKNLTPAGVEPHEYELTPQDMVAIQSSQLLVLNGGVEAWGEKVAASLGGQGGQMLVAGEGLLTRELSEAGELSADPHIWLSPQLAKMEVAKITAALVKLDPANQAYFTANATQLEQRLDQLDQAYQQGLAHCQRTDFITSHAAFGYLADAYGLKQVSIAGLSPDEEPSAKQLAAVAKFARDNQVKYIFFESLTSPKLAETLATEVAAQTLVLDPLEGLSPAAVAQGQDYFSVMQTNLANLQTALQCSK